jgi:hypothetical protein
VRSLQGAPSRSRTDRAKTDSAEALPAMKSVVYDAAVLIAADRSKRRVWAEHRVRLESGLVPLVPAPVVAQASRTSKQAQMRRLLRGCEVVAFDEAAAHAAGRLLGKTRTRDVVDASVAELSIRKQADVVSDHANDIRAQSAQNRRGPLLAAANAKTSILDL